jgi:hypothetical protein
VFDATWRPTIPVPRQTGVARFRDRLDLGPVDFHDFSAPFTDDFE